MNKKAFVTVHAGLFFIFGLILGAAVMWFLLTRGIIPPIGAPTP